MTEAPAIVVLTTLPTAAEAKAFVRRLVEQRVVACGTVLGDVTSIYRWQGAIEEAGETQVILKTRQDRWDALQAAVQASHPYDVPELLAVPVASGLGAYLEWVATETTADEGEDA
ncbi:MAG: divalent-cation tolerance protein CutA [Gemmatimonadota bacterium]|nr:MAG: divalent-cation tolerance protein CutA [Gemmatimonadota bacterium]